MNNSRNCSSHKYLFIKTNHIWRSAQQSVFYEKITSHWFQHKMDKWEPFTKEWQTICLHMYLLVADVWLFDPDKYLRKTCKYIFWWVPCKICPPQSKLYSFSFSKTFEIIFKFQASTWTTEQQIGIWMRDLCSYLGQDPPVTCTRKTNLPISALHPPKAFVNITENQSWIYMTER